MADRDELARRSMQGISYLLRHPNETSNQWESRERTWRERLFFELATALERAEDAGFLPAMQESLSSVPSDLDAPPPVFLGRDEKLAEALAAEGGQVVLVSGLPGVGKTTFAVVLARKLAANFPDGCIQIDAKAYSVEVPLTSVEVMRALLARLNIDISGLSSDPEIVVSQFRSVLASRKVLILIDNVRDPSVILDVSGGDSSSLIIATSRRDLPTVAARVKSIAIELEILDQSTGVAVLAGLVGPQRVEAELEAAESIANSCGGIPLALVIVGAKLKGQKRRLLSPAARALSRAYAAVLDEVLPDTSLSVTAALDWSYNTLTPPQQDLLLVLATSPLEFLTDTAVTRFTLDPHDLEQLLNEHLLRLEEYPWRKEYERLFSFHDLIRAYMCSERVRKNANPGIGDRYYNSLEEIIAATIHESEKYRELLSSRREAQKVEDIGELLPLLPEGVNYRLGEGVTIRSLNLLTYAQHSELKKQYFLSAKASLRASGDLLRAGNFEVAVDGLERATRVLLKWERSGSADVDEFYDEIKRQATLAEVRQELRDMTKFVELFIATFFARTSWAERCEPLVARARKVGSLLGVEAPPSSQEMLAKLRSSPSELIGASVSCMEVSVPGDDCERGIREIYRASVLAEHSNLTRNESDPNYLSPLEMIAKMWAFVMNNVKFVPTMDFVWSLEAPILRAAVALELSDDPQKLQALEAILELVERLYASRIYQEGHRSKVAAWRQRVSRELATKAGTSSPQSNA